MTVKLSTMPSTWTRAQTKTILAAICAHSVSISIGFCQAYSAILIPQLNASQDIILSSSESSWVASFGAITNPIGSIASGVLAEVFGRRRSIQITTVPFVIGWLCIAFATDIRWLYAGRLITGIGSGMATASYTYVSEVSPASTRGILQALGPVCASSGILVTYVLGYFISWNYLALVTIIFSVFTLISIQFLPESPAYLLKLGRNKASLDSLMWFRGSYADAQMEYLGLVKDDKMRQISSGKSINNNQTETKSFKSSYFNAATVKPFAILLVIFLLQELSGIYPILFYTISFFEEANMEIDQYVVSIIVGVLRLAMALVSMVLINRFGRKQLLKYSSLGMFLTLLISAGYLKYYELNPLLERVAPVLPLVCIMLSIVCSMTGMMPVPWILVGELFPLEVRSILSGFVLCIAQIFIFVTVKTYPDMVANLGFSSTLIVFTTAAGLQAIFARLFLPETRNKTLQEISDGFRENKPTGNWFSRTRSHVITVESGGAKAHHLVDGGFGHDRRGVNVRDTPGRFQCGKHVFTVNIQ